MQESFVTGTLAEAGHDAVEVALIAIEQTHLHGDALADDFVEADLVFEIGGQIDTKIEQLRDFLARFQSVDEQDVRAQGRRNLERPVGLCVVWHRYPPRCYRILSCSARIVPEADHAVQIPVTNACDNAKVMLRRPLFPAIFTMAC